MVTDEHRLTVLLADDHKLFVEPLRKILELEFDVVGVVNDGQALVAAVERLEPDIAIVDINMPRLNGLESLKRIMALDVETRVVFLTMHEDPYYAEAGIDAGASGYVLKSSEPEELFTAIREAHLGNVYVTPLIARDLQRSRRSDGPVELTAQQREVLRLFAEGLTAKEVAARLSVSRKTAEYHKYRLMRLLGLDTTASLILYAAENGIYSPPS